MSVCLKTFLDTFRIGKKRVRTIHSMLKNENYTPSENRGKHNNRPKKVSTDIIQKICQHIDSFPTQISHYARSDGMPERCYLRADLNISIMFRLFTEMYPDIPNIKNKKWAYTREFKSKDLRFGQPRADTCKTCDKLYIQRLAAHNALALVDIESKIESHHIEAESGYEEIQGDIHDSLLADNTIVLCVDLEQVC